MIRLIIIESTPMAGQLLGDALRRTHRFDVAVCGTTPSQILTAASGGKSPLALISLDLDGEPLKGCKVARQLRASYPNLPVVMLLDTSRREQVVEALRAGARGVFCRDGSIRSLYRCICSVQAGQVWANSSEMRFVLEALAESAPLNLVDAQGMSLLSHREQDVVRYVAEGLTNREIASQLKLSEHTVKNYLFRIFDKLGISSRVEMILYVFSQRAANSPGLISGKSDHSARNGGETFQECRKTAEEGNEAAQYRLAQMYRDGNEVPQDKLAAYMWFEVAEGTHDSALKGIREARTELARKMKPEQLAEAHRRAVDWTKANPGVGKLRIQSGGKPVRAAVQGSRARQANGPAA
jgi:DNA-binding NarL/FixJ family response regulator